MVPVKPFLCMLLMVPCLEAGITNIAINTNIIIEQISGKFLSVTIDTEQIQANWATLNFSSPKVQALAKALSPCYIRVGGSTADFLQFSPNSSADRDKHYIQNTFHNVRLTNFTMTAHQWDQLNQFVEYVGWDLIFDLNSLLRKNGLWLSDNAKLLLDYTTQKGYKVTGWELGNEPNVWRELGYNISGSDHARDYDILHKLLNQYPQWANAVVIGPSVTMLNNDYTDSYLKDFLESGGPSIVTNPTFHHYYDYGPSMTVEKFMDPKLLSNLPEQIKVAKTIASSPPYGKVWLGETSSAYDSGAAGLTDRYVDGFMWLDKLGIAASLGIEVVIRQDFYGGNYGLIDTKTLDPNPDFWLSYLYNTLVGQDVLNVTVQDQSGYVRMYAHCTNTKRTEYLPGSITVYGMNLKQEPSAVLFPQFMQDVELHVYMLQPVGVDGLKSQTVALNGRTLTLNADYTLPNMLTPVIVKGNFTFSQQSFGFIVIPNAGAAVCSTM